MITKKINISINSTKNSYILWEIYVNIINNIIYAYNYYENDYTILFKILYNSIIDYKNLIKKYNIIKIYKKIIKDKSYKQFKKYGIYFNKNVNFNNDDIICKFLNTIRDDSELIYNALEFRNILYLRIQIDINISLNSSKLYNLNTFYHDKFKYKYNGLYPYIDVNGKHILIKNVEKTKYNKIYYEHIKPFIKINQTFKNRMELYDNLYLKKINNFNNKYGVFTNINIKNKQCIGVYGGIIINKKIFNYLYNFGYNSKYLIDLGDDYIMDSINIISKINTIYIKNITPNQKNNAKNIVFNCKTNKNKRLIINAIFATKFIKKEKKLYFLEILKIIIIMIQKLIKIF
ncbi:hypothetical protein MYSEV_038 [Mythimna separata entomopoxvirus 'L']|uniref:Uncharacterized protein n=1 Tax=Mythimna separata entomopoxvirus 'L' TaxID=1293572 RepID=A0A916KQ04_9POXV|nr:hypothetical protein MYSEV_038 [Mythimna separata entomopoxvirus 'L']CCU56236.1 hypothetical protein MYSEV_038 [Mythimna separata entomopoxvirus 'L']